MINIKTSKQQYTYNAYKAAKGIAGFLKNCDKNGYHEQQNSK